MHWLLLSKLPMIYSDDFSKDFKSNNSNSALQLDDTKRSLMRLEKHMLFSHIPRGGSMYTTQKTITIGHWF